LVVEKQQISTRFSVKSSPKCANFDERCSNHDAAAGNTSGEKMLASNKHKNAKTPKTTLFV
jgi:hypothetical protein